MKSVSDEDNTDHIYFVTRYMFVKLDLSDQFRNLVVAAMIYLGYGPLQIEEEVMSKSVMRLTEYISAAKVFGFTADYRVQIRGNYV